MNALDYLRIYSPYADEIGGVHWSPDGDAVLGGDGATLALAGEVAHFLEGFSAHAELIHFAHVLHVFRILRWGPVAAHDELRIACAAFKEARGQARNAGVLFAHATAGMPRLPGGIDALDVCRRLRGVHTVPQAPSIRGLELLPTVAADEFERVLAESLQKYSFDELKHWFRHGRGPIREAAQALVRETRIEAPRSLAGIVETLLKHGRLSGAEPFLEQMISALTLPPRKMQADALPVGGYSGIATRGHPDQILPSEFAIDELEFLRRFAENELLYYRREQPRNQLREDMVVLIDQGVRTWGDVRLLLSAAALAFGEKAARKGIEFSLAGTSNNGALVNPKAVDVETVAELVEASDLSENPADALERVLEAKASGTISPKGGEIEPDPARDVVILTHPRSLKGDVELASRRAGPDTRVFAVTVDGEGNVEVNELRHGAPVKLSAFKVDLAQGAASRARLIAPLGGDYLPWTGSIESIGFPFRFAAPHGPEQSEFGSSLAFDQDGEWLFTASRGGLIHAYKLDGTQVEILPRAFMQGLVRFESIIGVAGGVALCGRNDRDWLICAHYDLKRRQVNAQFLHEDPKQLGPRVYTYDEALNAVCVGESDGGGAVNLSDGGCINHVDATALGKLVGSTQALSRISARGGVLNTRPDSDNARVPAPSTGGLAKDARWHRGIEFDAERGSIRASADGQWHVPLLDGKPALAQSRVLEAQRSDSLIALRASRAGSPFLLVIEHGNGAVVHETAAPEDSGNFLLSGRGKLALRSSDELRVFDFAAGARIHNLPKLAKCHNELFFEVGDYALAVYGGKFTHVLRWDHGKLEATHKIGRVTYATRSGRTAPEGAGIVAEAQHGRPPMLNLDKARFAKFAFAPCGLCFVSDVYGQLFVLAPDGACVAAFFVYRATVAVWLPDGTRYGPASISGGPTSPDALGRIGRALQQAVKGGAGS